MFRQLDPQLIPSRRVAVLFLSLSSLFLNPMSSRAQQLDSFCRAGEAHDSIPTTRIKPQSDSQQSFIEASSAPYRISWNGMKGSFSISGGSNLPHRSFPLSLLQTDDGPQGFAKHLVWFLSKEETGFSLLWCYLDDSGSSFTCWLYRYPENRLTPIRFSGKYSYYKMVLPTKSLEQNLTDLPHIPAYTGPDFKFQNWDRTSGTLSNLQISPVSASGEKGLKANKNSKPEGRSISNLTVFPLHEVEVGANNGWKSEGWGELHALAYDEQKSPFYLILYSNTSKGFVIDLKSPESFTTDFGGRVQFDKRDSPETVKEKVEPESWKKVALGDILELQLDSKKEFANPYQEVQVTFTMTSPEGVTILVPAFWDGGATWRLRFNPAKLGVWNYRTLSKIPELNGTIGSFVCIKPEFKSKGGIKIAPSFLNPRNFVSSNGDPFFPVPVQGSLADDIGGTNDIKKGRPDSFTARIDLLVSAGVNRIAGGYLLDGVGFESAFLSNGVLTSSGVKLFQKLDRRVAYCNEKGITPDFGLGLIGDKTFQQFGSEAVFRFWGYVVSRYSAYNVCWNLYERDGTPLSLQTRNYLNQLAELTRLYDSTHHPMTGVTPGYSAMAKSDAISDRAGSTPNFAPWQNYIVFRGGDVLSLSAFQSEKKPVFVFEPVSENRGDADIMRKRMWKARMSGAYWVGGDTIANTALESMAKFFAQTRFSNLEPHNEMLGGDRESAAARRRRKKAELELAKERENNSAAQPTPDKSQTRGDVTSDDSPPAAIEAPTILALATPAKEYVIYFESGGEIFLDLLEATGSVKVSWFNPRTGETSPIKKIDGGKYVSFTTPDTQDWVLHIFRR